MESDQKYAETWGELILVRRESYFQHFFNLGQAPGSAIKTHIETFSISSWGIWGQSSSNQSLESEEEILKKEESHRE